MSRSMLNILSPGADQKKPQRRPQRHNCKVITLSLLETSATHLAVSFLESKALFIEFITLKSTAYLGICAT